MKTWFEGYIHTCIHAKLKDTDKVGTEAKAEVRTQTEGGGVAVSKGKVNSGRSWGQALGTWSRQREGKGASGRQVQNEVHGQGKG